MSSRSLMDLLAGQLPQRVPDEREAGNAPVTLADLEAHEHSLNAILDGIQTLLARISQETERKQPLREIVSLDPNGSPYTVRTRGYRHNRLWAAATATVTVTNMIGNGNLSLAAGWNVLDMPDGSTLTVSAAATLLLELTDDPVQ